MHAIKTRKADLLYEFVWQRPKARPKWRVRESARQQVMPDDHSKVAPLLPIPNRTVKRLSADDSADSRVKVGHRQACTVEAPPSRWERFLLRSFMRCKRKRETLA